MIVCVIDFLWGSVIIINQLSDISRRKKFSLINFINLMFSFVYGFVPATILYMQVVGKSIANLDMSNGGQILLGGITLLSMLFYFIFNVSYTRTKAKRHMRMISDDVAYMSGKLILCVAWISFTTWTYADGGIANFIIHANGIRAGFYHLNNKFAFLEHVTKLFIFSSYVLYSCWLKRGAYGRKANMLFFLISVVGSVLFNSATDSRSTFALFFFALALIYIDHSVITKNEKITNKLLIFGILVVLLLLLVIESDAIMNYFRFGVYNSHIREFNLFGIIDREFGHLLRSQQIILRRALNGIFDFQFFNDIINGVFAWIPSRFIPFSLPITLWEYNTIIFGKDPKISRVPIDVISASLLCLWFLGILIFPIILGMIVKKVDVWLCSDEYYAYNSAMKFAVISLVISYVLGFSIGMVVLSMFYLVLGHLLTLMCNSVLRRKTLLEKSRRNHI